MTVHDGDEDILFDVHDCLKNNSVLALMFVGGVKDLLKQFPY